MPFSREQLETFRGVSVPDVLGADVHMLIVGVNPGLRSAALQASFAGGSNRFWRALYFAGILDHVIDNSTGFDPSDQQHVIDRGVGLTTLVSGATARADELPPQALIDGAERLSARVADMQPHLVALLGVTAYRAAFLRRDAVVGRQPDDLAGVPMWVIPNPSGLNARFTLEALATSYREAAIAAGIPVFAQPTL